jgi:hypothetical protein
VVYSSSANIIFKEKPIKDAAQLIQNMNFPRGGTIFDSGLEKMDEIVASVSDKGINIVLCFLTDGEGDYSSNILQRLL